MAKKRLVMAQKISESTEIKLDLKTIGMIVGFTISLASMYFVMQADIARAMELPEPQVTATEFQYKDQIIRDAIMTTQEDVKEMKEILSKLEERVYELNK
jgi:hypothetical protein